MKAHLSIRIKFILLLLILLPAGLWPPAPAGAQNTAVVQAVLFYRSTCSHCIQLVREALPSILEKYGDRLQIFYCNVSLPAGDALFTSAIEKFSIKTIGTPTLVVGETVLIGSKNIEEQFPGLIDTGLAQGGMDWPVIPGLEAAFSNAGSMQLPDLGNVTGPSDLLPIPAETPSLPATQPALQTPAAAAPTALPATGSLFSRNFQQDPGGNSLAVLVLLGMIGATIYGVVAFMKRTAPVGARYPTPLHYRDVVVPLLCLLGAGISGYLAYVEISLAEAICGPVGNCNAVQSSSYARLFGILPIGVLGLAGYLLLLVIWMVARLRRDSWSDTASLTMFGLTAGGLLFSIYLTFLEPFIIGASCMWCLTSAVVMTALFLLNIAPVRRTRFFQRRQMAPK
jgi:uncharacterized membrane protein